MILLVTNIFLAITDLIIPVFAINVFFNVKVLLSKYISFLLITVIILRTMFNISYVFIDICTFILIVMFYYKKLEREKIIYFIIFFTLINLLIIPIINIISFSMFSGYENSIYITTMVFNVNNIEFICKNFITIFLLMFQNINLKKMNLDNFEKKYWNYYYLINLMSFFSIIILVVICNFFDGKSSIIFSILSSVIVIFLYVYYCLFKSLYHNLPERHADLIEKSELQIRINGLLENKNTIEELKKFRHDIENNLNVVKYMLEKAHYQNAYNYVSNYIKNFDEISRINFSIENIIISAIINEKKRKFEEVYFEIKCFVSDQIDIKDIDLATIVGNLLDNAFEYVINNNVEKKVSLIITEYYDNLYIEIKNQFIGEFDKNNYTTTKIDSENHGYGLVNVMAIVNKYNGSIEIETNDNIFKIQILLLL